MPPLLIPRDVVAALNARLTAQRPRTVRCIGCGKFVAARVNWNQCADCDTREPEEMR